jgi:transposase
MLVEGILQKTLELRSHRIKRVYKEGEGLVAEIVPRRNGRVSCGCCGGRGKWIHETRPARRWQHIPLWGIPVCLEYCPRRVVCRKCGVRTEEMAWGLPKGKMSKGLVGFLASWAKVLSIAETARRFKVSWTTVQRAMRVAVEYGLEHRSTTPVRVLGVDEVSRRKRHVYLTVVYDLESGVVVWVGEGREVSTLQRFFEEWGAERATQIETACCDMWQPYIQVLGEKAPQAEVVFDRFHVVKHLNEAVDQVRREEYRSLPPEERQEMKRSRFLLQKNPWNLKPKEKRRLGELLKTNRKVVKAYYLKEAFQSFWDYKQPGHASRYLNQWFWWATHSRIDPLRDFAWMLRRHWDGIMAWTRTRVSNGALEGMNNKIKSLSHCAFGFRKAQTFIDIIYHCCGGLPEFITPSM